MLTGRRRLKISNSRDIHRQIGINYQSGPYQSEFIPMHALDAIDRKILGLLQSDSRATMQELADKVCMSVCSSRSSWRGRKRKTSIASQKRSLDGTRFWNVT